VDVINDRVLGYLAKYVVTLSARPRGSGRWGKVNEEVWARNATEAAKVAELIGRARNPTWECNWSGAWLIGDFA
jgi:hypothetical protein